MVKLIPSNVMAESRAAAALAAERPVSRTAAAVIALNGLFALITVHRQQSVRRFFEEELQRRQAAADAQVKADKKKANEKSLPAAGRTKAA